MRPLNLQEFAEQLRMSANSREADFADEILLLVDLEEEVAEPYSDLCAALGDYAPDNLKDKPEKQLEWLGDRVRLLEEIGDQLKAHERTGDVDDEIGELLETVKFLRETLDCAGFEDSELKEGLEALAELAFKAPPALEYDL